MRCVSLIVLAACVVCSPDLAQAKPNKAGLDKLLGLGFPRKRYKTPAAVVADQMNKLPALPKLRALPPFLQRRAKALSRRVQRRFGNDGSVDLERILDEAKDRPGRSLRGAFVDAAKKHYLLALGSSPTGLVLATARGRVRHVQVLQRAPDIYLKDVVADATPEVIVVGPVGSWVSFWPEVLSVYRIAGGRLRRIAQVDRSYSWHPRFSYYCFFNAVTFPRRDLMRVETVHLDAGRCHRPGPDMRIEIPKKQGQVRELRYKRGRFVAKGPLKR